MSGIESRQYFRRKEPQQLGTERSEMPLPLQAANIFRRVSVHYPTVLTAQAAEVALLSQQQALDPKDLWEALANDDTEIDNLVVDTRRVHKRSPNAPDDIPVNRETLTYIAQDVFSQAIKLSILEEDQLKQIIGIFPQAKAGFVGRAKINTVVNEMIKAKKDSL